MTVPAELSTLPAVLAFLSRLLAEAGCPARASAQIELAAEEIFANVAQYAYPDGGGDVTVRFEAPGRSRVSVTIADRGVAFDPLAREDPDTAARAGEREIGGLGVFLVKKTMDRVRYARREGRNVLTFEKSW